MAPLIKGDSIGPIAIEQKLQGRFRLLGPKGLTGMAIAGIDMAAWDALAKACALPLARLLGGELHPIPVYNSCGLGMIGSERAAAEAQELAPCFRAIKLRLGYADVKTDLDVTRSVRRSVGEDIHIMADYNQSLSVAEAIKRARVLDDERLYWIEEPTLADDFAGHAQIRREAKTPIQLGENVWGPHDLAKSIAAGASDFVMPDAARIGGVTGWMRAAALAEAAGLPLSSHLFPEVSIHLLAVSPTCHWLEYVDWASPILKEPLRVEKGHAIFSDASGTGISWDEAAVALSDIISRRSRSEFRNANRMIYRGSCHCGTVQFEVEAPERIECEECNCSICSKSGYLHLIVPKSKFRLLTGEHNITTYTFNTGVAQHKFCATCGIKSFYIPRSNPDGYDINVRCLEPPPKEFSIQPFDGKNWELHAHKLAALSKPT